MGKSSSQKRREKKQRKREREAKSTKKKNRFNKASSIIAIVLGIAVLGAAAFGITYGILKLVMPSKTERRLNQPAVTSEKYELTLGDMQYFFYDNYNDFMNDYGEEIDINDNLSLSSQYYNEEEGITWLDFFMSDAKASAESYISLASAAIDEGYSLDEDELGEIDDVITKFEEYGAHEEEKYTLEEYIEYAYGEGITEENIRKCQKIKKLANKYYNIKMDEAALSYEDEDYVTFIENNFDEYASETCFVEYMYFSFEADYEEDASEDEITGAKNAARSLAEELASSESTDAFAEIIMKYINSAGWAEEAGMTAEEFLKERYTAVASYNVSDDFGQWAFADERQVGDTSMSGEDSEFIVYCITKTIYFDETPTKNVRHILFEDENYESKAKAYEAAANLLNEWKSGDATEESFAELAEKNSADLNSSQNGGLYMYLRDGEMGQEEFDDWCFDENRSAGDTGIVETEYGYHIMYFSGDGIPTWQASLIGGMQNEDYEELVAELIVKYNVLFEETVLQQIEVS